MTQANLVQVACPECKTVFDVPDGAAEATCPNCGEAIVWRSCLDTNEIFTVLKKWETFVHPGCATKHPVDLTQVIAAPSGPEVGESASPVSEAPAPEAPEPLSVDPAAPVDGPGEPAVPTVNAPIQLAEDVEWADQLISGRLVVDPERLAIVPDPGLGRPPLSVAWIRDIQEYRVNGGDGRRRKLFGRGKKEGVERPTTLVLGVPGGQISLASTAAPDELSASLEQYLQPLINRSTGFFAATAVEPQPPAAPEAVPAPPGDVPPIETSEPSAAEQPAQTATLEAVDSEAVSTAADAAPATEAPVEPEPVAAESAVGATADGPSEGSKLPDMEPSTPEGVYESIRKLAELAVLGEISSDEFASRKAALLARL